MPYALPYTATAHLQQSTLRPHAHELPVLHLIQAVAECLCPLSVMLNETDTSVEVCLSELAGYSAKASAATDARICIPSEILEPEQQYLEVFPSSTVVL